MICPSTLLIHRLFFLVVVAAAAAPIVSAQWFLGIANENCDAVCSAKSLICNPSSVAQQILVNSVDIVLFVLSNQPGVGAVGAIGAAENGATTAPHFRATANPVSDFDYVRSGGTSNCDAAGPSFRRICCCLESGASAAAAAIACPLTNAPPPTPDPSKKPSAMPSRMPSRKPSSKPSRKPSAKPSMMPSLWKETCPGAFIPVLGLFMKLLCLLFKFITSPFR
jgi:hypothetical protein